MAIHRVPLIAGNWKMNGLKSDLDELLQIQAGRAAENGLQIETAVCLPAILLPQAANKELTLLHLGGQTCHANSSGAHTGDISAEMLKDAGAQYVIVGHSERRTDHQESDAEVRGQVAAAWRAGLTPILCVGETLAQREAGEADNVVTAQLEQSLPAAGASGATLVVAYEPVWAIGTGKTATPDDVQAMHAGIRATLTGLIGAAAADIRLLYGGSVKPANAVDLMALADVDGALVGGASLKAADFLGICDAYRHIQP